MEETKTTEHSTGGVLEEVNFPRSTIYVSANKQKENTGFTFQTKEGCFHFFLILNAGTHYTRDLFHHCAGRLRCYNCTRHIHNKVYLYPEDMVDGVPICNPLPHCRKECARRTVEDIRENHNLKASFYLMYGRVNCAPVRALLYMSGKLSVAGYHAMIDGIDIPQEIEPDPRCYNCHGPIVHPPIFYPKRFTKNGEPMPTKLPHCRVECALRTVNNIPHNTALKVAFFQQFGGDVLASPHRSLLYLPGSISLESFHAVIQDNLVVEIECPNVRAFLALTFVSQTFLSGHTLAPNVLQLQKELDVHNATQEENSSSPARLRKIELDPEHHLVIAPIYVSCTHLRNHQLVPDVIALTEEMGIESKTAAGPGRTRDNSELKVVELETPDLTHTSLSRMFAIDPASSRGQ